MALTARIISATHKELEVTASARATSECQGLRPLVVMIFILKLKKSNFRPLRQAERGDNGLQFLFLQQSQAAMCPIRHTS